MFDSDKVSRNIFKNIANSLSNDLLLETFKGIAAQLAVNECKSNVSKGMIYELNFYSDILRDTIKRRITRKRRKR